MRSSRSIPNGFRALVPVRADVCRLFAWLVLGLDVSAFRPVLAQESPAKTILDAAGVQGRLIVHFGCGDVKLTAALRLNEGYFVRAMVLAGTGKEQTLFIAGPRDVLDEAGLGRKHEGNEEDVRKQEAAYLGKSGGLLWAVSAADGQKKTEHVLDSPPVFDGMAAANGKRFLATMGGKVFRLGTVE
jgi:hypothetical protein